MPLAELQRVTFAYPGGPPVLRDVSLAVDEGEFVAVAGPNGGGKTTLLRVLLGLEQPRWGTASARWLPSRPAETALPDRLPGPACAAGDRLARDRGGGSGCGARRPARSLWAAWAPATACSWGRQSSAVGLAERAAEPVATLSGGQQQRAFIAKALAGEPDLLVLDEPTAGVDVDAQESLATLLAELHDELDTSILFVSHEFGAVEQFVERLVLVRGGIVFDGPPSALPGSGTTHPMSILDADFMRLAFAAGAIVGVLAPAVGFFLVQRGMSLIGDGIGHVAFAGVALGYLLGISPVGTALVASVLGAVSIEAALAAAGRRRPGARAAVLLGHRGRRRAHLRRRCAQRELLLVSLRLDPHGDA